MDYLAGNVQLVIAIFEAIFFLKSTILVSPFNFIVLIYFHLLIKMYPINNEQELYLPQQIILHVVLLIH